MKMAKITNAELVEKFESLVDRLISAEKNIEEHEYRIRDLERRLYNNGKNINNN